MLTCLSKIPAYPHFEKNDLLWPCYRANFKISGHWICKIFDIATVHQYSMCASSIVSAGIWIHSVHSFSYPFFLRLIWLKVRSYRDTVFCKYSAFPVHSSISCSSCTVSENVHIYLQQRQGLATVEQPPPLPLENQKKKKHIHAAAHSIEAACWSWKPCHPPLIRDKISRVIGRQVQDALAVFFLTLLPAGASPSGTCKKKK